ncbi:MAG: M1 family metallopeptidase [Planctomycetota bacterium]
MNRVAPPVLAGLLLLAARVPGLWAQEARFGPMRSDRGTESRSADLLHVGIELTLDERAKTFAGRVANRLASLRPDLRELWLDVAGVEIEAVALDGLEASYRIDGERLWVNLPRALSLGEEAELAVRYHGASPERGLYFIQPDADDPDLGWEIWSQGQGENNRCWIPTWDYPTDRATYSAAFTVRDGLTVVSNGAFLRKEPAAEGWSTWHFALDFPFPTYLISICAGDYERYADDFRGIPVEYYVQRGVGEETARRSFGKTPDMLAFFSDATGILYPYPKYSQVAVQRFVVGGMENISATTQTDLTLHDEREHLDQSSDGLVAHELAHQWWGDYLTCRTWRHLWLNEGFATYFEALYTEHDQGRDTFLLEMLDNQRQAIRGDRPGRTLPLVESFFSRQEDGDGSNQVYVKGSSVLHMIRAQLGDELWWRAIHHYGTKHAGELVDTNDFEVAIEEATGINLHWLFEEFVYLPGHPELEIAERWDADAKETVLSVRQTQDRSGMVPVFRYPVPIELAWDGEKALHTVWIEKAEQEVRLPAPTAPRMVRFDKGSTLLKTVKFPRSATALAYQAVHDDDVVGRFLAVEELAGAGDAALARATLLDVLASGDHPRVRAEAAERVAAVADVSVVPGLLAGLADSEPRVRRVCASALGGIADALGERRGDVVAALAETVRRELSYDTQEAAIDALGALGGDAAAAALREAAGYESPGDRLAAAAQRARVRLGDGGVLYEILALAEHSDTAAERERGLGLLGTVEPLLAAADRRERVIGVLLAAAREGPDGGRRAAIGSLGRLRATEARELLQEIAATGGDGGGRRAWRSIPGAARRALRQIDPPARPESGPGEGPGAGRLAALDEIAKTLAALEAEVEALRARLRERRPGGAGGD